MPEPMQARAATTQTIQTSTPPTDAATIMSGIW